MSNDEIFTVNAVLMAHVERLRSAIIACRNELNEESDSPFLCDRIFVVLDKALETTPAQSLTHIQAQVEEETIERCAKELKEYGVAKYIEEYVTDIERKYTKGSSDDLHNQQSN